MQKFTSSYGTVKKDSGTRFWEVKESFYWWINYETKNEKIIVPKGFRTDFASISRILWIILDPTSWNSFILHDYAFSICFQNNRALCDRILLQALIVEGCPLWQASLIYIGVRIGGGRAWNECKNQLLKIK